MVDHKQVIVVRTDLDMGRGKVAVQVAHAAVLCSEIAKNRFKTWYDEWIRTGQAKITVKVKSLDELIMISRLAEKARLPTAMVQDKGLTQLPEGTITCLGIGPAPEDKLEPITGSLKLL